MRRRRVGRGTGQARSTGSDAARLRRKLRPSSTCSVVAYGPGIRKHGRPARATPCEVTPRLGQVAAGGDLGGALVDEHDRGRSPEGDLLPQRPDAGAQHRVGRLVARGRGLEQVGDAVAGGDERVVGGLDGGARREDPRRASAGARTSARACPGGSGRPRR